MWTAGTPAKVSNSLSRDKALCVSCALARLSVQKDVVLRACTRCNVISRASGSTRKKVKAIIFCALPSCSRGKCKANLVVISKLL